MPQPREAPRRKRRRKAVPVLGAASLSLALASGAPAAVGGLSADLPARMAPISQQMTLRDEESTDVSLATFHVFDKENTERPRALLACSGACGTGFYYNPPVSGGPAYAPPPVHPTNKYRHSPKRT